MTAITRLLAASACALALTACATSDDDVLSDEQQFGINDDQYAARGADGMDGVSDAMRVGCNDDDQFEAEGCEDLDDDAMMSGDMEKGAMMKDTTMSDASTMMVTDSIADLVEKSDLTLLKNALIGADLLDTLDGDGPYTVFAPTDMAFTNADLSELGDAEDLNTLLLNHVVPGRFLALDFVELLGTGNTYTATAAGGGDISLYRSGDNLRLVNGDNLLVPILTADMVASNGVIHVIDQVLVPPMN